MRGARCGGRDERSTTVLPENASLSRDKCNFSLNHAIWDSCGHLGGRPRCVTVCCRGVRSLAFLGQFCPTTSIKLCTVKVRQFLKCGGIRGHESPRAGTVQGIYPVRVVQAKIQGTRHQRRISSSSPVKSGVQRTHDERVPPRNSTVLSPIELVCVQGETA